MIKPTIEEIKKMSQHYRRVPVSAEYFADTVTPITVLKKIAAASKRCFLLESVENGTKWGRYSFLGFDPVMRITQKNGTLTVEDSSGTSVYKCTDPSEYIRKILRDNVSPRPEQEMPFHGGFVGYFGYSMICCSEPKLRLRDGDFNDIDLFFYDKVIAFDHLRQRLSLIVNIPCDNITENYNKAVDVINKTAQLLFSFGTAEKKQSEAAKEISFSCNFTKDEYCSVVDKTKEYIKDGDIFQAVISRRFEADFSGSLINAYRVLRSTNPSPYMVYMKLDDDEIMSSSPETLVSLRNGRLYTFPVAGSRPRGKTNEEDLALENELMHDEKELSEHNMLVDLGRNDLGRISKTGTVEVTKYQMIHRYSKIMHICSQVEGNIKDECDALDAVKSVLPAGTLSGAPKIRACEIIEELEKCPRGIYGGALGYIDLSGNLDTCIAIRMAVKRNNKVYVQAGGGIVADSVPEREYEESYNKALAVMNAVKNGAALETEVSVN